MNPVLIILIILILAAIWFLASFLYKPLGKLVHGIWKEAVDTMNENDEENKEKDKEKGEM